MLLETERLLVWVIWKINAKNFVTLFINIIDILGDFKEIRKEPCLKQMKQEPEYVHVDVMDEDFL